MTNGLTERELFIWNLIARNRDIHWAHKTAAGVHDAPPPKPEGPKDEKGHPIYPSNQARYWKERRKKARNRRPVDPTWP